MMRHLYELSTAYRQVVEADDEAFTEALEQLEGAITEKAENLAKLVQELNAESAAIQGEVWRLQQMVASREGRVASIKDYLLRNLEIAGLAQVKGTFFTVAVRTSPPSCRYTDAALVDLAYQVVVPATTKVDSAAIIAHWKATGEQVAGAVVRQAKHVRIT